MTGLLVAAAVLILGTAIGFWRRMSDGRLRPVGPAAAFPASRPVGAGPVSTGPVSTGPHAHGADATGDAGPAGGAGPADDAGAAGERIDPELLARLGVQPAAATLLQFSTAFCAPCRAVRRVSAEVAALVPGVQHVEVDAESHLEAVRALGIWRTPTLLVLDADGRVTKRATGIPGKPQLIAALGDVLAQR